MYTRLKNFPQPLTFISIRRLDSSLCLARVNSVSPLIAHIKLAISAPRASFYSKFWKLIFDPPPNFDLQEGHDFLFFFPVWERKESGEFLMFHVLCTIIVAQDSLSPPFVDNVTF